MSKLTTRDLAGPHRVVGDELQLETCPVCGTGGYHFGVNIRTGLWNCFAGAHTSGGGRLRDPDNLRYLAQPTAPVDPTAVPGPPPEVNVPSTEPIRIGTLAFQYLKKRGISPDTIKLLSLRNWKEECRILIPFFGEAGDVRAYTGRDYLSTSFLKYSNSRNTKTLYIPDQATGDTAYRAAEAVVVLEGPLDAVTVFQCIHQSGWPARAAALGGARVAAGSPLHAELVRFVAGRDAVIWLDADTPGQSAAARLRGLLAPHARSVFVVPANWHGDCKDAGGMPSSRIADILRDTGIPTFTSKESI